MSKKESTFARWKEICDLELKLDEFSHPYARPLREGFSGYALHLNEQEIIAFEKEMINLFGKPYYQIRIKNLHQNLDENFISRIELHPMSRWRHQERRFKEIEYAIKHSTRLDLLRIHDGDELRRFIIGEETQNNKLSALQKSYIKGDLDLYYTIFNKNNKTDNYSIYYNILRIPNPLILKEFPNDLELKNPSRMDIYALRNRINNLSSIFEDYTKKEYEKERLLESSALNLLRRIEFISPQSKEWGNFKEDIIRNTKVYQESYLAHIIARKYFRRTGEFMRITDAVEEANKVLK